LVKIGVLALQGDFREHIVMLQALGAEAVPVRLPQDLDGVEGLIIPGGESTVIGKLMVLYDLVEPIRVLLAQGMPAWGTCAGMILLAKSTDNALAGQPLLATMDIHVARNAFGAQRESFSTLIAVPALGPEPFPAVFIRAPIVLDVGAGVEVLARLEGDGIIAVRQGVLLATAFHPEIAGDTRFHQYFLDVACMR
jgi:pyridoxal 5'-phosphate synthase pdxT subunit